MMKDLRLYGAASFHFGVTARRKWLQLVTIKISYKSHKQGSWLNVFESSKLIEHVMRANAGPDPCSCTAMTGAASARSEAACGRGLGWAGAA
jgi:hypothetical protein